MKRFELVDQRMPSRMIRDNSVVVDVDVTDFSLRALGSQGGGVLAAPWEPS